MDNDNKDFHHGYQFAQGLIAGIFDILYWLVMFVAAGWLLAWIIDNPTRAYLWFAADLRVVLPWFLAGFIFLGGAAILISIPMFIIPWLWRFGAWTTRRIAGWFSTH